MSSGLLDVERRVQSAALELLSAWTALTDLLADGTVVQYRNAGVVAKFPSAYVQGYNFAEFGLHTGNYMGGLRIGGFSYMDDDEDRDVILQIMGALRSWAMQTGLATLLNNTTSAQTAGSELHVFAVETDMLGDGTQPGYFRDGSDSDRTHEATIEFTLVCMPSRPT